MTVSLRVEKTLRNAHVVSIVRTNFLFSCCVMCVRSGRTGATQKNSNDFRVGTGRLERKMNINLVMVTGLAYAFIGALIMYVSHRAIYRKATRIVAGYPKVLSALRAQRHDGRFGLVVLLCGNVLQVIASCGYTLSMAHWRFPAYAVGAAIVLYCALRVITGGSAATDTVAEPRRRRKPVRRVYETRRSMILLEAARREAANRRARELAKGPRDRSVVYVGQDWECRWWSERFGVTPETLKAAVRQVGPMVRDVERHFSRMHRSRGYALAA